MRRIRTLRRVLASAARHHGVRGAIALGVARVLQVDRWSAWLLRRSIRPKDAMPFLEAVSRETLASMRVSVVVPTLNGIGNGIEDLLASLERQTIPPYEIVAIDSSSSDGTQELLRQRGAKLVVIPKREFRHDTVRNLGAKHASGNILLFTVQDAMFDDPSWIETGLRHLIAFDATSYSTPQRCRSSAEAFARYLAENFVVNNFSPGVNVIGNKRWGRIVRQLPSRALKERFVHVDDTNHLVKKKRFGELGGFTGPACEDMEFGMKVVSNGDRFVYSTLSSVTHSHSYVRPEHYARRVFFDNRIIEEMLARTSVGGDEGGKYPYLVDALMVHGLRLLTCLGDAIDHARCAGVTRVSFLYGFRSGSSITPFNDLENMFTGKARALLRSVLEGQDVSVAQWVQRLAERMGVVECLAIDKVYLAVYEDFMSDLSDAAVGHLSNALRMLESQTQVGVLTLEEFRTFGTLTILNTLMFQVVKGLVRGLDERSCVMGVMGAWGWV